MRAVTVPFTTVVGSIILVGVLGPTAAEATTPAIRTDPSPIVQTTVPADPLGGTIPLIYNIGIGQNTLGTAAATVTVVVDRPGCVLDVEFAGPQNGATTVEGSAVNGAPLALRNGAADPGVYSVSISERDRRQPACIDAPVGIAFGTQAGDRIVPVSTVGAAPTEADKPAGARTVAYSKAKRRTTLELPRALGKADRTYAVRITRAGRTYATGTLRGRTLRLTTTPGRARPTGTFTLRSARNTPTRNAIPSSTLSITR